MEIFLIIFPLVKTIFYTKNIFPDFISINTWKSFELSSHTRQNKNVNKQKFQVHCNIFMFLLVTEAYYRYWDYIEELLEPKNYRIKGRLGNTAILKGIYHVFTGGTV